MPLKIKKMFGKPFKKLFHRHCGKKTITSVDEEDTVDERTIEKVRRKLTCKKLYTIWSWLPARYAVCQPELLYTSEEHGTSLRTLYTRIENHQPTLILIKTTTDEVFGAFCSMYWRERKKSNKNVYYFGTGETFVFTLSPERKKYEWVGLHEENISNTANMFLAGDSKILTIGGGNGEAIQLDENLLHCRTEHCDTFDNPPLCSDQDFTCKVVEVYGFQ